MLLMHTSPGISGNPSPSGPEEMCTDSLHSFMCLLCNFLPLMPKDYLTDVQGNGRFFLNNMNLGQRIEMAPER